MHKLLLFVATALACGTAHAQLATFDTLTLKNADTFYTNYSRPGQDVGFDDMHIHFPCVYDTAFGGLWTTGFAYSNKKDSVTSGYTNMYAAKPARGYNGSDKYAVYWVGYNAPKPLTVTQLQGFAPLGFYLTNSTYAYNSMRDGDFAAKKFGGASGNDTDWFKLTVHAYKGGTLKPDSVTFYLADFRFANNAQDYIVKDWRYVNLTSLGPVDSIFFTLSSSDNGAFGMNTPAYFCMDNMSVSIPTTGVSGPAAASVAKVYPNPATDRLIVELNDATITLATVYDMSGKMVLQQPVIGRKLVFNTVDFAGGMYVLKLEGVHGIASLRFIKQ